MLELDEGIHDIWVSEDMVTLGEAYTYLYNQEKLKSIESAKILVGALFSTELAKLNVASCLKEARRATKTSRISSYSYWKRACYTSSKLRAHGGIIQFLFPASDQPFVMYVAFRIRLATGVSKASLIKIDIFSGRKEERCCQEWDRFFVTKMAGRRVCWQEILCWFWNVSHERIWGWYFMTILIFLLVELLKYNIWQTLFQINCSTQGTHKYSRQSGNGGHAGEREERKEKEGKETFG